MAPNKTRAFVIGDRVRCVDAGGYTAYLTEGETYTVSAGEQSGSVSVGVRLHKSPRDYLFDARRFALVADTPVAAPAMRLPTTAAARKAVPICTGVLDYFPDAIADVARLSKIGNDQHNPGEPLHWARGKSMDQADCILRHQMDRGTVDVDGVLHDAKVAWRALAQLQLAIEKMRDEGVAYPPVAS